MVFARNQEEGEWVWGEHTLPRLCAKKVIDSRTRLNQLQ